ncbi:MAG: c-type cytochrome [Polyangiaceae bacterium]|nr:c-type cytochrome [Polyangiaceae bacterium]
MKIKNAWFLAVIAASAVAALGAGCDEPQGSAKPAASASATATASASASAAKPLPPMPTPDPVPAAPAYAGEMKIPADNPMTPAKIMLGKQLFFDKRLSKDGSAACLTCHLPEKGWTDGEKLSKKVGGAMNTRHSPTLLNVGYNDLWYWDGRSETLEKQILAAWKGQMGAEPEKIADAIGKIPGYEVQFKTVFGANATGDTIVKALAAFVRTIRAGDAPWDKYTKDASDKSKEAEASRRGFALFRGKAGCAACHAPPMFTNNDFHNVGIGFDKDVKEPDLGRGKITNKKEDNGKFKVPTLRNVGTHPPYFHDGRAATLDEAIDYMLSGGLPNENLDKQLKKITLTKAEREDLVAFIRSLESPAEPFKAPTLPQ